jgi:hypothetical protein
MVVVLLLLSLGSEDRLFQEYISRVAELLPLLLDNVDHSIRECKQMDAALWLWKSWMVVVGNADPWFPVYIPEAVALLRLLLLGSADPLNRGYK